MKCRHDMNAKYVLDLVDAPVDQDHSPAIPTSTLHSLFVEFNLTKTTPAANRTRFSIVSAYVDILLVASLKQQRIYSIRWPNISVIVARHHHTNYSPQYVYNPLCNNNNDGGGGGGGGGIGGKSKRRRMGRKSIGMIGFTIDNIHIDLINKVNKLIQRRKKDRRKNAEGSVTMEEEDQQSLIIVNHTKMNAIASLKHKVMDSGDMVNEQNSNTLQLDQLCLYVPIKQTSYSKQILHKSTTAAKNISSVYDATQSKFHQLKYTNAPSIGLLWPPIHHSNHIVGNFFFLHFKRKRRYTLTAAINCFCSLLSSLFSLLSSLFSLLSSLFSLLSSLFSLLSSLFSLKDEINRNHQTCNKIIVVVESCNTGRILVWL
jgi:hypothetical protein